MKYPILYARNETDFFNLGLGVMTNTLKATVIEERNGSFFLESSIIIDNVIYPQLENDQLIKADAGHKLKEQRFRVKRIVDNHNGTASIYAEHISYLSSELSLKPEVTVSGNGSTALTIWKSSLMGDNSFVVDSDISTSNITKWRIDKVQNARQALGGVEGSILEKWGGEYRFDNYHISLLSKRGTTADVLLAYGRNITDFEQERNIANTFNSVYPYAIYTDDKQQEHLITLSDYFVDSSNIDSFPNRKAQTVDFSSEFDHGNIPTQDKLKSLAQKYIKSNGIGVPTVSIKVSFVDLSKTEDYASIGTLEQLNLCDEVRVIYPKLKVNTTAKIVRIVWNVLAESYDEIEIGEKRVSLSDKISEQTKFINEVKTSANAALVSANGKNTNFYGLFGQDGKGEPKATKVGDLWYKPNGDKSELYQWDGTVWSFIISTDWQEIFEEKLTEELSKTKKDLDAALAEKDKAIKDLDNRLIVNDQAISQAQNDLATNQNAIAIVKKDLATNTQDQATLKNSLSKLDNDLKATSQEVSNATVSIATVKKEVSTANATANEAVAKADGLLTRVSKAETTILQQDGQIKLKANQITVDSLTKRVTDNETSITQQDQVIQLKASQSSVDSLTDRTTKAESKITQMATDINLRVTKDDIINQINIAPEGVLISANKLMIDMTGNLVQNSEFNSNSWNSAWGLTNNQTTPVNYTWGGNYTDGQGGFSSGTVVDTTDTSKYSSDGGAYIYQEFPVVAGTLYSFSYMLAINSYVNGRSMAWLRWYDANGNDIRSDSPYITQSSLTSPIWVLKKSEGNTAPTGATRARIYFKNEGNLRSYITRVMVNRGAKVMAYNSTSGQVQIYGDMVVTGAITSDSLATNAVIAGKISANAVTSATIAAGAITTAKLDVGAVTAITIGAGAVIADKIATSAITAEKIATNAVTAEKISVNSLAAITGNLGTLTAGVIDAAVVTVRNINASNITTGILSADRIAANSITATHISISSLSALSANLGTITAGTINAATVNIININAGSITSGVLNADRIGANSITADKINATSLDLFSNDSYTNVRSDGMRIQSKAHIIFGPWIDINGNRRSTQGIYIGGFGGGTKHVALTRSNGTTFLLRAEDGMDYGANRNVTIGDLNLYDSVQFWESARVHGNLINEGYIAMGGGIQEASIQYDKPAGTMNFRVPGARSGSYFWFNQRAISEGSFDSKSKLSLKNVKGRYKGNALTDIVNTDIVEYSYKNDPERRQLSPIIDDINKIKKYNLPDIINDGESVNLYAMNSMSWLAIKQLAQKLETIEEKLDAIA